MKASEYKTALIQAIEDSIAKRWEPRVVSGDVADVEDCHLCALKDDWFDSCDIPGLDEHTHICPLDTRLDLGEGDIDDGCGLGWHQWQVAEEAEEQQAAAKQVIADLRAIDVNTWTAKLVAAGMLEE